MPPIARAAHVFGDVKLQLSIDTSGRVSAITILQGPEMLRSAAVDAVRQWTYRPFIQNEQPVNATTVVTLAFSQSTPSKSSADSKVAPGFIEARTGFVEAEIDCHEKLRANAKLEKQLKSCSQAAAKADAMQTFNGWEESRMDAYLTAASVLLRDHQYEIVRTYANKALALVESGYGGMAQPCAVYTTRAEAEWGLKEATNADRDFTAAEGHERSAVEVIQDNFLKKEYTRILKNVLDLHVQFLQAEGKTEAAQAKAAEAAKL